MVQNTRHLTLSVDILAGSGKKALDWRDFQKRNETSRTELTQ